MAGNRLHIVPGTSPSFTVDLVDDVGNPTPSDRLIGASAKVRVRTTPDGSDVLLFTTLDPAHVVIDPYKATVTVKFSVGDTNTLTVGTTYTWQLELDTADGGVSMPVDWSPVDVDLGGSAAPTPPTFPNTVKLDENYMLPDNLRYMTPGGSPIENAQVRVYLKSDYDAGNLASPAGFTTTNAYGRWKNPILVAPGFTYTVRFEKPYEFGPDTQEVVALSVGV